MNTRKQIIVSAVLIGLAAGGAGVYAAVGGAGETEGAAAGGHNHGALGSAAGDQLNSVRLGAAAEQRIGVTYATAAVKPLQRTVALVGNVTYDETRLSNVNLKIEGWIERLYVDFTGAPVVRGQPLLEIYSPMLVSAQEELILARRLVNEARGSTRALANAQDLLEASRRRLRYWDIPEDVIAGIERTGTPAKTLTLRAPATGTVVEKMAVEGSRVMPGMDIYKIADLSRVWVEGEVFEKDLSLVRQGARARVSFESYPGEVFLGPITYIYPEVGVDSRTGRIRVELQNPELRLKPGMYAKLELTVDPGRSGLLIPRAAVHHTGERSMVFVRGTGGDLIPRDVATGLVVGGEIEVLSGLLAGEVVVASANFLIDAESNMGSSMSSLPGQGPPAGEDSTQGGGAPAAAGGHVGH